MNTKKLRIAVVVGTFPTVSETFIVNQINALEELGHEVVLFSYHRGTVAALHASITSHHWQNRVYYPLRVPDSYIKRILFLGRLLFHVKTTGQWGNLLRAMNVFKYRKKALSLRKLYQVYWFIREPAFAVVHAHFGPNAEKIGKLKSMGFLNASKLVATFHGFDLIPGKAPYYKEAYAAIWKHFDAVTVNTPYLEGILNQIPITLPKGTVLPMGLDTRYFESSEKSKPEKHFQLLFVGRLIALKGVDVAIKAVALLKQEGVQDLRLNVVGEGDMEAELKKLIIDLDVSQEVILLGALDQQGVKEQMEQSHVLVMPGKPDLQTGRKETQGLVIQEAQAMGLPVLVSNVGGMQYGMVKGETGFVFNREDMEELKKYIVTLKNDAEMLERFGKNARTFAVKNYDYRILGQRLEELYRSILP